ncbi:ATP-dependent DNA helicase PIF6-like [Aphis craccivora]|uniref:ATP-dependent DNA helicase PIF6-like n=1 Tax=Aphis craccivora TaxID=307492 RepID=A0A6G0YQ08_APHCR|nr:ATP-dependent DNA helicase PIF6-like [Aphis craccivora]
MKLPICCTFLHFFTSFLCLHVTILELKTNMRVVCTGQDNKHFAKDLLLIQATDRAILSPTNERVDKSNDLILSKFDAQSQFYYSIDTVLEKEDAVHFPTEFLNFLLLLEFHLIN